MPTHRTVSTISSTWRYEDGRNFLDPTPRRWPQVERSEVFFFGWNDSSLNSLRCCKGGVDQLDGDLGVGGFGW